MCTVSMIGDHYSDKWTKAPAQPWTIPNTQVPYYPMSPPVSMPSPISRAEFEALKKDVEEMKALLIRAKEYDEKNGEPDCEMDAKVALLKQVAKFVGVSLKEVWPNDVE